MAAAVDMIVTKGAGLREASQLYNVPIETLRRRVNDTVPIVCRPGLKTILTKEDRLARHLEMSNKGFGLTREDVMSLAFVIAEKTGRQHPFQDRAAGRSWYNGFMSRHPRCSP